MLGFGRYLFARDEEYDAPYSVDYNVSDYRPTGTFKVGISIGKRF